MNTPASEFREAAEKAAYNLHCRSLLADQRDELAISCVRVAYSMLEEKYAALTETTRWRDVREELPPFGLKVLAHFGNGWLGMDVVSLTRRVEWTSREWNCDEPIESRKITHWRPLPPSPQEPTP